MAGSAFWLLLQLTQRLALGGAGTSAESLAQVPLWRRIAAPTVAGLCTGLGWWLLRSRFRVAPVTDVLRDPTRRLVFFPTWLDAVLQTVLVGAGASIGREGAPRQGAAAIATWLSDRFRLDDTDRRTLVAAAAGAGLAAVYNVPLSGVVYVLEVLLMTRRWNVAVIATLTSLVATVTAWPVVGRHPVYQLPSFPVTTGTWAAALLAIPLAALLGTGFARLTSTSRQLAVRQWTLLPLTLTLMGLVIGGLSCVIPELAGNGKAALDAAFSRSLALTPALLLTALKPTVTAGWLWSDATGGLLTPALATGGATGVAVAMVASETGHPLSAPQIALIMAVGVLATTQRAPLFAATFGLELTHATLALAPALILTALGARNAAEVIRGYRDTVGNRHPSQESPPKDCPN